MVEKLEKRALLAGVEEDVTVTNATGVTNVRDDSTMDAMDSAGDVPISFVLPV